MSSYEYVVQGKYAAEYGWEDLEVEDDKAEAERLLGEYQLASGHHGQHRVIRRKAED